MNDKHFVLTIERQYGSGGRLTGKRLAEELGIHFYDEEILKMTSETSAIGEQYFRLADERAGNNLLYRIVTGMKPELTEPDKDGPNITSPENLFRFQSSVIRRLAASETCIIVGRCGNYVIRTRWIIWCASLCMRIRSPESAGLWMWIRWMRRKRSAE